MSRHYVELKPGGEVMIDIGGWGVLAKLDDHDPPRWYDVAYIKIEYGPGGEKIPTLVPADMVVAKGKKEELTKAAEVVRIWRHQKYPRPA